MSLEATLASLVNQHVAVAFVARLKSYKNGDVCLVLDNFTRAPTPFPTGLPVESMDNEWVTVTEKPTALSVRDTEEEPAASGAVLEYVLSSVANSTVYAKFAGRFRSYKNGKLCLVANDLTRAPTSYPTPPPSFVPTGSPSSAPTHRPTRSPLSAKPTFAPSRAPSKPTYAPSDLPTYMPTWMPTDGPSAGTGGGGGDSAQPTWQPTTHPTGGNGPRDTPAPTRQPTR